MLPLLAVCVCILIATLLICLETLRLNDTARIIARAVSTSEQPQDLARSMIPPTVSVKITSENSQILTVQLAQKFRIPLFGISVPTLPIRATSHILYEPPPVFP